MNGNCKVNYNIKDMANEKSLNPQDVMGIANVLWDDVSLIDQYMAEPGSDSEYNIQLVRNVFLCHNASADRSNFYSISRCDYFRWFGYATWQNSSKIFIWMQRKTVHGLSRYKIHGRIVRHCD